MDRCFPFPNASLHDASVIGFYTIRALARMSELVSLTMVVVIKTAFSVRASAYWRWGQQRTADHCIIISLQQPIAAVHCVPGPR